MSSSPVAVSIINVKEQVNTRANLVMFYKNRLFSDTALEKEQLNIPVLLKRRSELQLKNLESTRGAPKNSCSGTIAVVRHYS